MYQNVSVVLTIYKTDSATFKQIRNCLASQVKINLMDGAWCIVGVKKC